MKKVTVFLMVLVSAFVTTFNGCLKSNTSQYKIDTNLIKQISSRNPNYITIDKIPDNLKNAVISVEDKRFYFHNGFDYISITRALYANVRAGKIKEGGSTITQQLAKNLFLTNDRTFKRKFEEIFFTMELERKYTKDQILEMYFNVIYYGSNTYGVQNASRKYFNKDLKDLSLEECALLAGIPQAPNSYNPDKHPENAQKRKEVVLAAMKRNSGIPKTSTALVMN